MKEKEKTIAVLEIASASIGGLLFQQNKSGKLKIISLTRVPLNFLFDINFDVFWRCAQASFKKVLEILLKDYPCGPDACFCVFLSPWFLSQTKVVNIKKEKAFEITNDFFNTLMKCEKEDFKNKDKIEHEIVRTELNGYCTKLPIGKIAKTVKLYIYMSWGIGNVKEKIEERVLKNFGDIPLSFGTFPLVAFHVLSSIVNVQEGLILVDIGGETTDISLIRRGCLEETISFPRGKNFLLRKIASGFKTFPEEANSILQTYLRGHSFKNNTEKISQIIERVRNDWSNFFELAIKNISEKSPLPQKLFLISDEIIGKWFIKCVEEERFSRFTFLGKPFSPKIISSDEFLSFFEFNSIRRSANQSDIFLILETIFVNKFLKF